MDEEEARFGVDILQNRKSVPLCWKEVGHEEPVPIALLKTLPYSLRLTNNGDERVVARVSIDGQALRCLYHLAPHSKHTVSGRRISRDEQLPFNFQMTAKKMSSLKKLPIVKLLPHFGSVDVQFYKAKVLKDSSARWRSTRTQSVLRAWANDTASAGNLHSATAYGAPQLAAPQNGGQNQWTVSSNEPLAVATVYLVVADVAPQLGLNPCTPTRCRPASDDVSSHSRRHHSSSPTSSPNCHTSIDNEIDIISQLHSAQNEAIRWRSKFEQLAEWVEDNLSHPSPRSVSPPQPVSYDPRHCYKNIPRDAFL
eukprot:TRINITY_DN4775_c6_g1_i1.p1 TRINITY_DN4775_c6_g1~~TRINITY_DN4775_c6_g1_i1.p1  ORF type:complete len:310 (+),score=52.81 TRINITY_DN4775_c6_g1_i1:50-979(+)